MGTIKLCRLLLLVPALYAGHNRLLPQPQQIRYGEGRFALKGVTISFGSTPLTEDLFAADELAKALSDLTGVPVPVMSGRAAGRTITLYRTGAADPLPGADDRPGPDSRESYAIRITPSHAEIRSPSSAGLYYAVQTLRQLVEQRAGETFLPEVEVRDWPALAYRGFMMDMSHGPLPTEDEIKRQIDFLARWKANQYYFYNEANIELRGYSLLNPGARYSQQQIRRIVDYARARHVDVVPCLELYGHLHDLFRVERYADLGAFPHGGEINPRNPKTQALLHDWVEQLSALFPSPWFHVGMDEPWELEKAGSQAAGGVEPGKLYMEQLKSITALVRQFGKRPMFWADVINGARIFVRYPELLSQLPKDVIAVPWHYDVEADFSPLVAPFAREKVQQVFAPGIWCWDEISPDFLRSFQNIDGFLADARKYGTMGMINTGWTDASQVLYRTALPAMAYGAAAAWQQTPLDREQFFADYAAAFYSAPVAAEIAPALESLAKAQQLAEKVLGSETIFRLWDDPLTPARLNRLAGNRDSLREIRLLAEEALERLDRAQALKEDTYSLPSLIVAARILDYAGMKYIYAQEMAGYFKTLGNHPNHDDVYFYLAWESSARNHGRIMDLMDEISDLRGVYRSAWLAEYTDHRLRSVLGRWEAEYEYWRRFQTRLWDLIHKFKDGDTLPDLEDLRPRM
ncbi:MAG TPA: beta-N-acetylhexosaminidase [Bryobacteraceae bacterium]|nr:beta-N-acetylhexosaminidase [Bryobacteraceae bacterium]